MGKEDQIQHWVKTAELDWTTAEDLLKLKRFLHALFFFHLVLGKLLKAHWVKANTSDFLAIWDEKFTGCIPLDVESLIKLKVKFPSLLELHTYHASETVDSDPFIGEIEKHGILIDPQS